MVGTGLHAFARGRHPVQIGEAAAAVEDAAAGQVVHVLHGRGRALVHAGRIVEVVAVGPVADAGAVDGDHVGAAAGVAVGAVGPVAGRAGGVAPADRHRHVLYAPIVAGAHLVVVGADAELGEARVAVVEGREQRQHVVVGVVPA